MAMSLLEALGLSPSSGYNFTLPDDVQQQIASQPQGGVLQSPLLQGISAGQMNGDNGQGGANTQDQLDASSNAQGADTTNTAQGSTDSTTGDTNNTGNTGSDSNPSYDSTPSLLSAAANGDKSQSQSPDNSKNSPSGDTANTGNDANPSYDQAGAESDNSAQTGGGVPSSPTAPTAATNANAGTNAIGDTTSVNNNGDTPNSANDVGSNPTDQSSFLSRLMHGVGHMSPEASQAVLSAGLGMLAHSQGADAGWSSIGDGAQQGMQTYMNIKQQEIANALNAQKLRMDNAKAQSDISLQTAQAGAATTNASTEAFKAAHPNAQIVDTGGQSFLYDPISKTFSAPVQHTLAPTTVTTAPGSTTSVAGGSAGPNNSPTATAVVQGGPSEEVRNAAITTANTASQTAAQSQANAQQFAQAAKYFASPGAQDDWANQGGLKGVVSNKMKETGLTADTGTLIANQLTNANIEDAFKSAPQGMKLDRAVQNQLAGNAAAFNQLTSAQKTYFLTYMQQQAKNQSVTAQNTAKRATYAGTNGDAGVATQDYKDGNGNVVIAKGTNQSDFLTRGTSPTSLSAQASKAQAPISTTFAAAKNLPTGTHYSVNGVNYIRGQ